jgi:hypothetical protein
VLRVLYLVFNEGYAGDVARLVEPHAGRQRERDRRRRGQ